MVVLSERKILREQLCVLIVNIMFKVRWLFPECVENDLIVWLIFFTEV